MDAASVVELVRAVASVSRRVRQRRRRVRQRRLAALVVLAGVFALAFAPLLLHASPLPKPCRPASTLVGRDSVYLYLPCADVRMLDSATRAQLACTVDRMKTHGGWPVLVYETYRSDARQYRLWLQGRPQLPGGRVGVVVTKAKRASQSAHGTGYGVDIIHARDGWSNRKFYQSLALHAFECGLEAGADWPRFPDAPHVQSRVWTAARKRQVGGS